MKILAIESSCDEFAAAVVEDGRQVLAEVIHSQIDIHQAFGGVVPEVAARSHVEVALPVVDECLRQFAENANVAGDVWNQIDAIAVTANPGLIGSLMIGTLTARTLALLKNKPLYAVNHILGHVYANWLSDENGSNGETAGVLLDSLLNARTANGTDQVTGPPLQLGMSRGSGRLDGADESRSTPAGSINFPALALVVSGGHTQIMLFRDYGDYETVGQTVDDAVGEAFDKVAKIIGLSYPGGPSIAAAAAKGDMDKYHLPKPRLDNPLNFSFSGLKTAVLRAVQAAVGVDHTFPSHLLAEKLTDEQRRDFAASFQKTAVEVLVEKMVAAAERYQPKSVCLAGGVAANKSLREKLAETMPVEVFCPSPQHCTDNAAMIGAAAYFLRQKVPPINPKELEIFPTK
ncbi:MAG: tRNA (adenosine(37)-N6)-threonylcarbamoyltransferase complex transferase subunit TsaD [Candidatus Nomurabacteria bacterium]|nr:tRNA (adenosine(37)-N6)-threonylcarbamoyltransferase complex transferase subunit TsaD [Candidatus Nomurabacteria bacterium]